MVNAGWRNTSFRGYADYMDTPEFSDALDTLAGYAGAAPTAFMCAEALWWQCHRRLIADHLVLDGWEVRHIAAGGRLTPHRLPDFARVVEGRLVYDRGATPELPMAEAPARPRRP